MDRAMSLHPRALHRRTKRRRSTTHRAPSTKTRSIQGAIVSDDAEKVWSCAHAALRPHPKYEPRTGAHACDQPVLRPGRIENEAFRVQTGASPRAELW